MSKSKNNKLESLEESFARVLARLLPFPRKIVNSKTDLYEVCEHAPLDLKKFQRGWLRKYNLKTLCANLDEFLDKAENKLHLIHQEGKKYYLTSTGTTYVAQVKTRGKALELEYDAALGRAHDVDF